MLRGVAVKYGWVVNVVFWGGVFVLLVLFERVWAADGQNERVVRCRLQTKEVDRRRPGDFEVKPGEKVINAGLVSHQGQVFPFICVEKSK